MNKIEATFRERQLSGGVRVDIFEVKPSQAKQIQAFLKEKGAKLYPNVKFDEKSCFLRVAEEIPGGSAVAQKVVGQMTASKLKSGTTSKTTKRGGTTASKGTVKGKQGYATLSDLTGSNPIKGQAIHIGWERLIQK